MKIKLRNRLEVLMKDSGVGSFEEMARRLTESQSLPITRTAVSRKFRDEDISLSLSMIEAICNELQCLPGDLFETEVSDASPEFLEDVQSRLQPFRYGVIRLKRPGNEADAAIQATSEGKGTPKQGSSTVKATSSRVGDRLARSDESLVGPSVTHLHVDKLKK